MCVFLRNEDSTGAQITVCAPTCTASVANLPDDLLGPFLEIGIPAGGLFSGAEEVKTEEEAAIWGGTAGVAYDVNYHKVRALTHLQASA